MPFLATSPEKDFCHAKRASDITSWPVADNPLVKRPNLQTTLWSDNPSVKRPKLNLALSPAAGPAADVCKAKIDWVEILSLRRDHTNRWYDSASCQDPEEDELEAFGCACSTCLLRDQMEQLVGRDVRIKNRMACELGEITAHRNAYTQGTRELYSEMQEIDEYACACDWGSCCLDKERQQLEGVRDLWESQMMEQEDAYEHLVERLDVQRRALQMQMQELQAHINVEESSTEYSICLFHNFTDSDWRETIVSDRESLGCPESCSGRKFRGNKALRDRNFVATKHCEALQDLRDLGEASVQQHKLDQHTLLTNSQQYLHEIDILLSRDFLETAGVHVVRLDMTAAGKGLLLFVLTVLRQHLGCFDKTPILQAMLKHYLDCGITDVCLQAFVDGILSHADASSAEINKDSQRQHLLLKMAGLESSTLLTCHEGAEHFDDLFRRYGKCKRARRSARKFSSKTLVAATSYTRTDEQPLTTFELYPWRRPQGRQFSGDARGRCW